ncbi:MAG: Bacteriophage holin of superfamily 6 [Candidatus Atribacteria bacterium]|nr:Bacteriophage holin of superfamily 6 [Candidatus Atribacteria bacterium]
MEVITDLLVLILPTLLTAIFSWLGIDRIKFQRYQRLIEIAEEAVLWADDYYPESEGVEKLKQAIVYFKSAAQKAGFWVSDEEAEKKVRIAYQALQRQALNNLTRTLVGE